MKQSFSAIIFNRDEDYSATMRSDLLSIPGMHIVAELDELALIENAITQFPVDLLVAHLDPAPDAILPVITGVAQAHPELAVYVVSESTDGKHILIAMRAGVREFLTKPVDRGQLELAAGKLLASRVDEHERGTLISILGVIGGAGASMLAANLAAEISDLTRPGEVALVDLDFRYGHLGTMLDLQADYTIAELADTPEQVDTGMIEKAMVKHESGLHLLARPNSFAQADQITGAHCAAVLTALRQVYKYVVVDGPMRFDPGGLAVLDMADINILLIQLLVTGVRNLHRMLEELRNEGYNLGRFMLVCNRVGRDSTHLEVQHVEQTVRVEVAHQIPDDWKQVGTAINMGVPLMNIAPRSRVRLAIRELAEKIITPESVPPETNDRKGTLLDRLFQKAS